MKRIFILVFIFILSFGPSSFARLGENREQLIDRYGQPISEEEVSSEVSQYLVKIIKFNKQSNSSPEINIEVYLDKDNVCQHIRYISLLFNERDEATWKDLIEKNSQGMTWERIPNTLEWERSDGGIAQYLIAFKLYLWTGVGKKALDEEDNQKEKQEAENKDLSKKELLNGL